MEKKTFTILLLTNRDSDNVGDQVIEACDIALIHAAMKNLNIAANNYKIISRAAGIVTKNYLSTRNPEYLKSADSAVQKCDLIIFGGAPLFNYLYQVFYERTAITLELAQKYNKPVIFSAIGIESYHEDNEKCQRLKKTLNFDCVKQITTRDGYSFLQKYKENENLVIDQVSDPAVFSKSVFKNYITPKQNTAPKIGIFVLRANGFKDNKVNFSKENAAELWKNLTFQLSQKGYDYELLTSGHFGDEAFLDSLIRKHIVPENKCSFNINTPEILAQKISSFDAVISCRLHPSIISFAFDIPSIGIVWNSKVKGFYDSIGYTDRVIETTDISSEKIISKLEAIMDKDVHKDSEYLVSVYTHLFTGIKNVIDPDSEHVAYTYDELLHNIPAYEGTSKQELELKLKRKFRRTYEKYNSNNEKSAKNIIELKAEIKELKKELRKASNPSAKQLTYLCLRKTKNVLKRLNPIN